MSSLQWGYTVHNHRNHSTHNSPQKPFAETSAKTEFLDFMKMSTAEKMRAMVLKELGMTEEQVKNMPAEERKKIEAEILERMKKKLEVSNY